MTDPFETIAARMRERGDRLAIRFLPNGKVRVATKNGPVKLHWDESRPEKTLREAFVGAGLLDPSEPPVTQGSDDEFEDLLG